MKFPSTAYVHKVPEGLMPEEAVFCEPLSCSVHAVERAKVNKGDVVVVSGISNLFHSSTSSYGSWLKGADRWA